jgi:hypothetical protein
LLQRFIEAPEFKQRLGMAEQNARVIAPMPTGAERPLRLRIVPAAECCSRLRQFHTVADRGRIVLAPCAHRVNAAQQRG